MPSPQTNYFDDDDLANQARKKWDRRYANHDPHFPIGAHRAPRPMLVEWLPHLPKRGTALDIAAGSGRNTLLLAAYGLAVDAWDISWQGLRQLNYFAGPTHVVRPAVLDLGRGWLPLRQYEVIVDFFFLERPLLRLIADRLKPGGWFLMETFTVAEWERPGHNHTRRNFFLEPGELPTLCPGLTVVDYREGIHDGKPTARLVARNLETL